MPDPYFVTGRYLAQLMKRSASSASATGLASRELALLVRMAGSGRREDLQEEVASFVRVQLG